LSALLARFISPENTDEIPDEIPDPVLDRDQDPELPPDPAPAPVGSSFSLPVVVSSGKVTPALKKRISAELEAYIEMAALPLVMSDPHCGTAIHEQAKPMADAIAQILSRYPEIAHKFMAAGVFGDWLKLLMAVRPVVMAVYSHHIAPQPLETPDDAPDFPPGFDPFRPGS
jgi:hypothetical protein